MNEVVRAEGGNVCKSVFLASSEVLIHSLGVPSADEIMFEKSISCGCLSFVYFGDKMMMKCVSFNIH